MHSFEMTDKFAFAHNSEELIDKISFLLRNLNVTFNPRKEMISELPKTSLKQITLDIIN